MSHTHRIVRIIAACSVVAILLAATFALLPAARVIGAAPSLQGPGAPLAGGYVVRDSSEPGGPLYDFQDISLSGTALALGDDELSAALPLGFDFLFFTATYTDVYVSSNGFLTFLPGPHDDGSTPQPLPDPTPPNGLVALWWADLNPTLGGTIHYARTGMAPNRIFVIQYSDLQHAAGGNPVTAQVKLFEGLNTIEVHYASAPSDGGLHTAGIENQDGTAGVEYARVGDSLVTPLALRYSSAGLAISKSVDVPEVVRGSTVTFTIEVTNTGLVPLTGVTVSDPRAPRCSQLLGALAPGATTRYACTLPAVRGTYTNVATVEGSYLLGPAPILDAIFANRGPRNRYCLGDGVGGFACDDVSPAMESTRGVALGDVNGDTFPDAVFANENQPNQICLGDGVGGFTCADVSADARLSTGVALGDVNGDNWLDAVFAVVPGRNQLCLGDGAGRFSCADFSADAYETRGVALGDVNGDQFLDALFANNAQQNRVCLGDGAGSFSCANVSADRNQSLAVALGDINNDSFLDAVFANAAGQPERRCLGDGNGGFACADVAPDTTTATGVALGHVDDDLHLDAVFALLGAPGRLCLGNGSGGFTCSAINADSFLSQEVALADMNSDSLLDAVFANQGQPNRLCLGNGTGGLTCSNVSTDTNGTFGVAVGDLGGPIGIATGRARATASALVTVLPGDYLFHFPLFPMSGAAIGSLLPGAISFPRAIP